MTQTDQERQNGLVITSAVLTSVSLLVVITRSVVRIGLIRKGGWDDYLMIVAMVSPPKTGVPRRGLGGRGRLLTLASSSSTSVTSQKFWC